MLRIIRSRTLATLRADLATAEADAITMSEESGRWHDAYQEEVRQGGRRFERLLTELARARVDCIKAERERDAARAELTAVRKSAAGTAEEFRALLEELRAAAHTPDTGTEVQGRIALELVRRALDEAVTNGTADPMTRYLAAVLAPDSTEKTVLGALAAPEVSGR